MIEIEIENDGPAILRTTYWRTEHAKRGLLYLSVNAATLRLLVPPAVQRLLGELPPVGTPCELVRSVLAGRDTYQFAWLDDAISPYVVEIDQQQIDRRWPSAEDGRILSLVWYGQVGVWGVVEQRRELVQLGEDVAS